LKALVATELAVLVGVVSEEGRERLLAADCDCELLSVFILLTTLFLIIFIGGTVRAPEGLLLVDMVILSPNVNVWDVTLVKTQQTIF